MEPFDPSAAPSEESPHESRPPRRERSERRPRQDKKERAPREDNKERAPRAARPPRFGDEVSTEAQPDARSGSSGAERRPRSENEPGRGRDRGRDRGNDRRPRRDDHDDGPAVVGFGDHMPSFLMKPVRVAQPEATEATKAEE